MDVVVEQGSIQNWKADTIIVNLFRGVEVPGGATGAVDEELEGAISEVIASGEFQGKVGEISVFHPRGNIPAQRVIIVGLGEKSKFGLETVRKASAAALKKAEKLNANHVASIVHGAGIGNLNTQAAAQATIEGALLAAYQYDAPKQAKAKHQVSTFSIVEFDQGKLADIEAGKKLATGIAAGAYLARDLVNMPPNQATPSKMAKIADDIGKAYSQKVIIGDRAWAAERKMGAFLAVAKGAGEPPKFIVLEHNGDNQDLDTLILVGKGITFDTGGISLKRPTGMGEMKSDMAGAAAVLGVMKTVGELELPLRIIGIAPCTENMPDANAYRPADVIEASNGKTIEIISTDAEGRMVLADGLVYAKKYDPAAVIDLATLTGSCITALGRGIAAGLFSTDEWLADQLVSAGETVNERVWPLPLWPDYKEFIKSDVADVKNSGGRFSGVGSSAIFLKEFTDYPWAHLDIAGMALNKKASSYVPAGGTGFGVRILVQFLSQWKHP